LGVCQTATPDYECPEAQLQHALPGPPRRHDPKVKTHFARVAEVQAKSGSYSDKDSNACSHT
jgi:hypothetical protein